MPLFVFFADAAGTTLTTAANMQRTGSRDGAVVPPAICIYFGDPDGDGTTARAASDPGVDPILVFPVDDASGSGAAAANILLATTEIGLDSATPGASISIGTSLAGGLAGMVPIWIRYTGLAGLDLGVHTDVHLAHTELEVGA